MGCVKQDGIYRDGDLIVAPNPPKVVLAEAYLRFAKEDLLPQIFYEGVPDIDWFLETFSDPKSFTLGCYRAMGDSLSMQGLGWVNHVTEKPADNFVRAEVGIAFFRATRLRAIRFGELMLTWIFENTPVDVIYGTTPEPNEKAWKYAERIGMKLVANIPWFTSWDGDPCGVWISHLTRKDWALTA